MVEIEFRPVAPVGPITGDVAIVLGEGRVMIVGEAFGEGEGDGRLLGAGVTGFVLGFDGAPVVGGVVGPVCGYVGGVCGADLLALDEVVVMSCVVGAR